MTRRYQLRVNTTKQNLKTVWRVYLLLLYQYIHGYASFKSYLIHKPNKKFAIFKTLTDITLTVLS